MSGNSTTSDSRIESDSDDLVEVNVGFSDRGFLSDLESLDAEVRREFAFGAVTIDVPSDSLDSIRSHSAVEYVEENGPVEALGLRRRRFLKGAAAAGLAGIAGCTGPGGDRSDPVEGTPCLPWGIDRVDADVAHRQGMTGSDVDVAVVDTGIDADHPDLADNLGEGHAVVECSGDCDAPWDDDMFHGTHCAGTIGAIADNDGGVVGVAPEVTLHAVKVLDGYGRGDLSNVAAGIEHVADKGWDVASMSLGSPRHSELVADAVDYAHERGVFVIVAAGNSGPCSDCVASPADHPDAVAVSATTREDDLAEFSSTGPEIDIAAPGKRIASTIPDGEYKYEKGTSMACPHVSGAAALLLAQGLERSEARQRLLDAAEDLGLDENDQGQGLLDVASALGLDSSNDGTGDCLQQMTPRPE